MGGAKGLKGSKFAGAASQAAGDADDMTCWDLKKRGFCPRAPGRCKWAPCCNQTKGAKPATQKGKGKKGPPSTGTLKVASKNIAPAASTTATTKGDSKTTTTDDDDSAPEDQDECALTEKIARLQNELKSLRKTQKSHTEAQKLKDPFDVSEQLDADLDDLFMGGLGTVSPAAKSSGMSPGFMEVADDLETEEAEKTPAEKKTSPKNNLPSKGVATDLFSGARQPTVTPTKGKNPPSITQPQVTGVKGAVVPGKSANTFKGMPLIMSQTKGGFVGKGKTNFKGTVNRAGPYNANRQTRTEPLWGPNGEAPSDMTCWDFKRGFCKRGDFCKWVHSH